MKTMRFGWMVAVLALAATGCGGDDDADKNGAPLEVIGEWESTFGDMTFPESITAEEWGFAAIVEYDNDANVVITQNPDGDDPELNPNEFSRIVYLEPEGDSFYYCITDYGLETLEDARAADTEVDDSNPDEGGCGSFSWTKLTKQ